MNRIALIPEDIPQLFVEAWNRRDADAIAELFEDEADFINVVGIWWQDKEAIRKAHEYGLRIIFNNSEIKLSKVKVKYLADDIAIIHARMRLSGQSELVDKQAGLRRNIFLFVTHRVGDKWLCVSAQNTDIVHGAETNIRQEDGTLVPADYRKK